MTDTSPDDERQKLLRLKEQWAREHQEALETQVPIDDDVPTEDYQAIVEGRYVEKHLEVLAESRPRRARSHISLREASWVLGHADTQSLSRIARLGQHPQRKHYTLPWSREDHHRVLFKNGGRYFVDFHYWDRRLLTPDQLKRLEAIEFEPDDSAT